MSKTSIHVSHATRDLTLEINCFHFTMNHANETAKLAAAQAKVRRQLTRTENAWATWRGAAQSAHLAAGGIDRNICKAIIS